jgi:hypothetical protein
MYTQLARSEENLLTVRKNCSQKSNLLRARICSKNLLTAEICLQHRKTAHDEKPSWLGWINTMAKCLASSQSEHGWRAPLKVSVVTAGTCWAGPSSGLGQGKYLRVMEKED